MTSFCHGLMAERKGFEPLRALGALHDFQSCALDQLSHLSTYSVAQRFDVAQLVIGHCSGIFHGKHPPFSLVYMKYPQAGEKTFRVLR